MILHQTHFPASIFVNTQNNIDSARFNFARATYSVKNVFNFAVTYHTMSTAIDRSYIAILDD